MEFEVLETNRLLLRKLTPEVFEFVYENYSDAEITAFFNFENEEAFIAKKKRYEKGMQTINRTFLYFQLIDKETNAVLGWCGYHTWYLDHDRAEIGYGHTHDHSKGKGLMSEALKKVIDYGFTEMNLNRIEAFASAQNLPSIKLLEKNNFTKEGCLREHYVHEGNAEDSDVYGLLRAEYEQS